MITASSDGNWSTRQGITSNEKIILKLDTGKVESMFRYLESLNLPVIQLLVMELDGTTFSFTIEYGFNSVSYQWWMDIPNEYLPLKKFIRWMVDSVNDGTQD